MYACLDPSTLVKSKDVERAAIALGGISIIAGAALSGDLLTDVGGSSVVVDELINELKEDEASTSVIGDLVKFLGRLFR